MSARKGSRSRISASKQQSYQRALSQALAEQLAQRKMTQLALAQAMNSSPAYVSYVLSGTRTPSPAWLNTVSQALTLSEPEYQTLVQAAVHDLAADFLRELDLTKK